MSSPVRIMHVITGLEIGGAEQSLHQLLSVTDRNEFDPVVVSLTTAGRVAARIERLGVEVRALGLSRSLPNPWGILSLAGEIRRGRPEVIQTWMYHADLLGGVAAWLAGGVPVAWGIRHSDFDWKATSARTRYVVRACARLSRVLPTKIVSNSHVAREFHGSIGYDASKIVVIPNGFDLVAFRPDPRARREVREEIGVPDDAVLIGAAGRFHPQKDHATLAAAAAILAERDPGVRFALCGEGIEGGNPQLAGLFERDALQGRVSLLGRRDDMPRILAALDVATSSSSYGEAFPRVLGEAMACGVPCVATDVGDSAIIVEDTGIIVPPRNAGALADAWSKMISMGAAGRARLGKAGRARIREHYEAGAVGRRFAALHKELAGR